ncbi:hypothetical protein, partial [Selenomonas noxia]
RGRLHRVCREKDRRALARVLTTTVNCDNMPFVESRSHRFSPAGKDVRRVDMELFRVALCRPFLLPDGTAVHPKQEVFLP